MRGSETARLLAFYLLARMVVALALLLTVLLPPVAERPWALLEPSAGRGVCVTVFAAWALSVALLGRFGDRPAFVWTQLSLDAALATVLIHLTTGVSSGFFVIYLLNIMASAFLVGPRAVLLVAGGDAALFTVYGLMVTAGWLSGPQPLGPVVAAYEIVLRVFALLLVGALVTRLAVTLRAVESEQALLLDQMRTGVLLVDGDGRIAVQNPAARELLGSAVGRPVYEVLGDGDDRWECTVKRDNGTFHLLCSQSPRAPSGALVLVEDVTRLREMESAVAQEENLAAVGRLTAALAHEIRNPLASLSGAVQLLQEDKPDPLHDIVLREVRRISDLVDELLDRARPTTISPVAAAPEEIAAEVALAFAADPRYRTRIDVQVTGGAVGLALIDPERFRRVLWNLLLNAAQAMPDRGQIAINFASDAASVSVTVSDTGVGIAPADLKRIFDPFYTTRSGGSGLGLATVQQIVRAHSGEIDVESDVGKGTLIRMRFPRADDGALHAG